MKIDLGKKVICCKDRLHGEKLIRLSRVVKTGLNNVVLHPMNSIVNNVVEPSILLQLVETSCNNIDGSTTLSQQVATTLMVQQH